MDYDKILLELLNRIVILEEKVAKLERPVSTPPVSEPELTAGSKKYRFLSDYLMSSGSDQIRLTFEKIEDVLGFELPESATIHRAFWANTTSHSIALSWLSVNYSVVEVDLEKEYVVFEKKRSVDDMKINDQMRIFVQEMIGEYGVFHEISVKELHEWMNTRFKSNTASIMPYDYCYNHVNKGSDFFKRPRLFEMRGNGIYACLGESFPYDGSTYTKPNGVKEKIEVGLWRDGEFEKNANWDIYCTK